MNTPVDILLIEDNLDDAELALHALRKSNLGAHVIHLRDGDEALTYMFDSTTSKPRVILLDLKMPKVDGIEVLRALKSRREFSTIPVVMLTSSQEEQDIVETYQLGVNAYIVKPVDFGKFDETMNQLGQFWLHINHQP